MMNKLKQLVINFVKIILILLPILVFSVYFCITFRGPIYILNVNQTNINAISEALSKDNIKVDNLNDVNKIEVRGRGLWNYDDLNFLHDNNGEITYLYDTILYNNEHYYIRDYLEDNCFDIDLIFNISILISLSTIFISLYKNKKEKYTNINCIF